MPQLIYQSIDYGHWVVPGFFFGGGPTPTAYGGSQARGLIGAVATSLHHSYSNTGSEPHLQPAPQLSNASSLTH